MSILRPYKNNMRKKKLLHQKEGPASYLPSGASRKPRSKTKRPAYLFYCTTINYIQRQIAAKDGASAQAIMNISHGHSFLPCQEKFLQYLLCKCCLEAEATTVLKSLCNFN